MPVPLTSTFNAIPSFHLRGIKPGRMERNRITALVCANHDLYRKNLCEGLTTFSLEIKIIGETKAFDEALPIFKDHKIDFLLIRFDRSIKSPFDFIKRIKGQFTNVKIIVLTFWDNDYYNRKLMEAGAFGYYLIDQDIKILIEKIESNHQV